MFLAVSSELRGENSSIIIDFLLWEVTQHFCNIYSIVSTLLQKMQSRWKTSSRGQEAYPLLRSCLDRRCVPLIVTGHPHQNTVVHQMIGAKCVSYSAAASPRERHPFWWGEETKRTERSATFGLLSKYGRHAAVKAKLLFASSQITRSIHHRFWCKPHREIYGVSVTFRTSVEYVIVYVNMIFIFLVKNPFTFPASSSSHTLPHSHMDASQPISSRPAHSAAHLWLVAPLTSVSCSHFYLPDKCHDTGILQGVVLASCCLLGKERLPFGLLENPFFIFV